jgi:NADPH:quinone reductase-like Zn-dependent oxidoreductase
MLNPSCGRTGQDGRCAELWATPGCASVRLARILALRRTTVNPPLASRKLEDLETLRGLLKAGTIRPVIDRTYPFDQIRDALRYLEAGHARGKVVVTV